MAHETSYEFMQYSQHFTPLLLLLLLCILQHHLAKKCHFLHVILHLIFTFDRWWVDVHTETIIYFDPAVTSQEQWEDICRLAYLVAPLCHTLMPRIPMFCVAFFVGISAGRDHGLSFGNILARFIFICHGMKCTSMSTV